MENIGALKQDEYSDKDEIGVISRLGVVGRIVDVETSGVVEAAVDVILAVCESWSPVCPYVLHKDAAGE